MLLFGDDAPPLPVVCGVAAPSEASTSIHSCFRRFQTIFGLGWVFGGSRRGAYENEYENDCFVTINPLATQISSSLCPRCGWRLKIAENECEYILRLVLIYEGSLQYGRPRSDDQRSGCIELKGRVYISSVAFSADETEAEGMGCVVSTAT